VTVYPETLGFSAAAKHSHPEAQATRKAMVGGRKDTTPRDWGISGPTSTLT
jgi:hypothetical protein